MGSLTGVVASKSVTEAPKGTLTPIGNRGQSVMAEGCLTGRQTCRAGTKVGLSDPVQVYGNCIAQRVENTLLNYAFVQRINQAHKHLSALQVGTVKYGIN